jgi:hypothetical protein
MPMDEIGMQCRSASRTCSLPPAAEAVATRNARAPLPKLGADGFPRARAGAYVRTASIQS